MELHILADQSALNARTKNQNSSVLDKARSTVVVKQLIEWRVDLEAKDDGGLGWTAIYLASLIGDHAKIRMLIEARADVNAKTK